MTGFVPKRFQRTAERALRMNENPETPGGGAAGKGRRAAPVFRYAAALVLISVSVLAVLVMWRPAPRGAVPGRFDFAQAVAVTDLASAAVELPLYGYSEVTLGRQELANIAAALLAVGRALPEPVAEAIRLNVPREVVGLEGLDIESDMITVCLRCRRGVTFYVTVEGRLLLGDDGGLDFALQSARVGLLPLPVGLGRRIFHLRDITLLDPDKAGFQVERYTAADGAMTLDLAVVMADEGGA